MMANNLYGKPKNPHGMWNMIKNQNYINNNIEQPYYENLLILTEKD